MFLLTSVIISLLLYLVFRKKRKETYLDRFLEPPGHVIFGHALEIASPTSMYIQGVVQTFSRFLKNYGTTIRMRIGPSIAPLRVGLLSVDYKFVEFILSSNKILKKGESYKFLKPWLGNGLILSYDSYWKKHRKILTPAFHFEILKQFVDIFESVGDVLVQKLEKYEGTTSIDLQPLVTLCTLDIICETAMGTRINAQSGKNTSYVNSVHQMCEIVINRCLVPYKFFAETFWLTKDYYSQKLALKTLHTFTNEVISFKKGNHFEKIKAKKMAFLDMLLKISENGNVLTEDEIREEVDTFMFAGHDTTSSAICFALYCLANHPKIQDRVLQEQRDLLGDEKNPPVTYSELQSMKFLERVIKESLRLYPPVTLLARSTTEDIEFEGSLIPKDTNIGILLYDLHRNPDYFPDPERFNPDRFENFDCSRPYAYVPFSAGPRNCIGQKFALLEMKSILSKIVRHFELKPAMPQHQLLLSFEIVLKSATGVRVGLKKRI